MGNCGCEQESSVITEYNLRTLRNCSFCTCGVAVLQNSKRVIVVQKILTCLL